LRNKSIKYYSTNLKSPAVTFRDALLRGLAPDGGLYIPGFIPVLTKEELIDFRGMEYYQLASEILSKYTGGDISNDDLVTICRDAYNFEIPLEKVIERKYIMRLDMGPTSSFKDFAARIMSRLMQYFLALDNKHLTILTATSGDTGGAVASAFKGMNNIKVIILFPANEVSPIQRKQMTTLDGNINVIAVNGKFDDCQNMVKMAFTDRTMEQINLSSANSINIGRLLPQSVYYFFAWSQLALDPSEEATFSVPSGNFGNLMGGLTAKHMGLPVRKFIMATNENREVPEFLKTGIYKAINPSINCISSAMNVGHPSNLARIVALYGGMMDEKGLMKKNPDIGLMKKDMFGISISDNTTRDTISEVHKKYDLLLEPHGAVAWNGLRQYLDYEGNNNKEDLFVCLETAHPAKFPEEILRNTGFEPELPPAMKGLEEKTENFITAENDYEIMKKHILNLC
jgi:threonine synthase